MEPCLDYGYYKYSRYRSLSKIYVGQISLFHGYDNSLKEKVILKYLKCENWDSKSDVINDNIYCQQILNCYEFGTKPNQAVLSYRSVPWKNNMTNITLSERINQAAINNDPITEQEFNLYFLDLICLMYSLSKSNRLLNNFSPFLFFVQYEGSFPRLKYMGYCSYDRFYTDKLAIINPDPVFISPEILNRDHINHSSQIYALGILIYYICSYRLLSYQEIQSQQFYFPSYIGDNMKNLVINCLSFDFSKRYTFADLFLSPAVVKLPLSTLKDYHVLPGRNWSLSPFANSKINPFTPGKIEYDVITYKAHLSFNNYLQLETDIPTINEYFLKSYIERCIYFPSTFPLRIGMSVMKGPQWNEGSIDYGEGLVVGYVPQSDCEVIVKWCNNYSQIYQYCFYDTNYFRLDVLPAYVPLFVGARVFDRLDQSQLGTIVSYDDNQMNAKVQWDNGTQSMCPFRYNNQYKVQVYTQDRNFLANSFPHLNSIGDFLNFFQNKLYQFYQPAIYTSPSTQTSNELFSPIDISGSKTKKIISNVDQNKPKVPSKLSYPTVDDLPANKKNLIIRHDDEVQNTPGFYEVKEIVDINAELMDDQTDDITPLVANKIPDKNSTMIFSRHNLVLGVSSYLPNINQHPSNVLPQDTSIDNYCIDDDDGNYGSFVVGNCVKLRKNIEIIPQLDNFIIGYGVIIKVNNHNLSLQWCQLEDEYNKDNNKGEYYEVHDRFFVQCTPGTTSRNPLCIGDYLRIGKTKIGTYFVEDENKNRPGLLQGEIILIAYENIQKSWKVKVETNDDSFWVLYNL